MCYESRNCPGGQGDSRCRRSDEGSDTVRSPPGRMRKLRDSDAMLNAGKDLAAVLQALEVSEATHHRWRAQYGGMKAEEAVRLKKLEDENKRLKEVVAELTLDNRMLKYVA